MAMPDADASLPGVAQSEGQPAGISRLAGPEPEGEPATDGPVGALEPPLAALSGVASAQTLAAPSSATLRPMASEARLLTHSLRAEPTGVVVRHLSLILPSREDAGFIAHWRRQRAARAAAHAGTKLAGDGFGPGSTRILSDVSCAVEPRTLTAILGPSGCGKTSLLNVMAGRLFGRSRSWKLVGAVRYNGKPWKALSRDLVGYVRQDDELLPYLTVEETLGYAAALRLPASIPEAQRAELVDDVIRELGLKECRHTLIGSPDGRPRGCSGGERRRVSIGVQLLTNPSLLFLDEPTTGLDAFTAFNLVQTLQQLARSGRTVVLSVHQPRTDIFDLFDNVIFLAGGRTVYAGPQAEIGAHFRSLGVVPPPFTNAADHYLDVTSVDVRSDAAEERSRARIQLLVDAWRAKEEATLLLPPADGAAAAGRPPLVAAASAHTIDGAVSGDADDAADDDDAAAGGHARRSLPGQIAILTGRALRHTWRDRGALVGQLVEHTVLAVVLGYIFFQVPGTLQGIRTRQALMYATTSLQPYVIMLFELQRLALVDIRIFDRERQDRMYTTAAYVGSHILSSLPMWLVLPPAFATILYFMTGLRTDPLWHYGVFVAAQALTEIIAAVFALLAVAIARDFSQASLVANACVTFFSLVCGFFIQFSRIPVWLQWIRWISQFYYSFRVFASNEFTDNVYDCPYPAGDPRCIQYDGNFVLETLDVAQNDYLVPFLGLIGWAVVTTLLFYVILRFNVAPAIAVTGRPRAKAGAGAAAGAAGTGAAAAAAAAAATAVVASSADLAAGSGSAAGATTGDVELRDLTDMLLLPIDSPATATATPADLEASTAQRASPVVELRGVRLAVVPSSALASYWTKQRVILDDVNVTFAPGRVNVILGGSGSGKSSLLNAIARRTQAGYLTRVQRTGDILVDGRLLSAAATRRLVSYVMQDDTQLLPFLTVQETVDFAAQLRLPREWSRERKRARAAEVLQQLGLRDCAHVLIGNGHVKGISGGQKRRVSIAVQILARPSVLLLDEPTSGLDAFMAQNVMRVLHQLARSGMTIVCTIHQPRSDLFELMEGICILSQGRVAYAGPGAEAVPYFGALGFPCPETLNPADYIVDITSVDLRTPAAEAESRARVARLIDAYAQHYGARRRRSSSEKAPPEDDGAAAAGPPAAAALELDAPAPRRIFPLHAAALLVRRSYLNLYRQPLLVMARLMQVAASGVIFTIFFTPLGDDYIAIQSRIGLYQQVTSLLFVGLLNCVAVFPDERRVFYREYADGLYGPFAFLFSYMVGEVPTELLAAAVFAGVMWGFSGLRLTAVTYFTATYVLFCYVNVGESVGQIFCILVEHVGVSVAITSAIMSIVTMTAGFMAIDLPRVIEVINYANPLKYGTAAIAVQDLDGRPLTCDAAQQLPDGSCIVPDGNAVLEQYYMSPDDIAYYLWALAVCVAAFRLVAYVLLRLRLLLLRYS